MKIDTLQYVVAELLRKQEQLVTGAHGPEMRAGMLVEVKLQVLPAYSNPALEYKVIVQATSGAMQAEVYALLRRCASCVVEGDPDVPNAVTAS